MAVVTDKNGFKLIVKNASVELNDSTFYGIIYFIHWQKYFPSNCLQISITSALKTLP